MLGAFFHALEILCSPWVAVSLISGSVIGVVIGIIPVLGALMVCAVALPFIYGMQPEVALTLLVSIWAAGFAAGSMTAILLNIPGTGPNAATLIDGYPLTQKGQAGRAMGAAFLSSAMGGVLSVLLAFALIPVILSVVRAFQSPELFLLTLLGISLMATMSRGSMIKSLISGCLGLVVSFVGFSAVTGESRFTFGSMFLYDGIRLVPFILGIFGIPELLYLAAKNTTIAKVPMRLNIMRDVLEGFKDVFRHFWLFLRSTIIGFLVGTIPGIGAEIATFASYAQAKKFSKHPERFGTGCIEGVIAPESANNASQAGTMLPTLAFGIPGGAMTAIFLGAFILVGIVPGPGMLTHHLALAYTLLIGIALANVLSVLVCLLLVPWASKLAYVPARYLVPLVLTITFAGTYSLQEEFLDLVVLLVFSALGYAMKQFDYPRPPLVLGFILGHLSEKYFFISLTAYGWLFFLTPLSLMLIAIMIILLFSTELGRLFRYILRGGRTKTDEA